MEERTYLAIDLKSFYASVECRERGLDPMDTNLVVADESRTDKTICLAVTPSLKTYGIPGRPRLFEVVQKMKEVNSRRQFRAPDGKLQGRSCFRSELQADPRLEADYLIAPPRMAYYVEYSTKIYRIYLKYIAPEDIVVYSIDEVFLDVTHYLKPRGMTARELAMEIILDVLSQTGITATAGIGTNLYLAKVAMDIVAKRMPADRNGVRIAALDELGYRKALWSHRPLTDFWRVGRGTARKLEQHGLFTMGDVARCSVRDEDLLYRLFGKNAELLIDHAWGWEPCTVAAIKAYRPRSSSLCSGQVLHKAYPAEKGRLVLREAAAVPRPGGSGRLRPGGASARPRQLQSAPAHGFGPADCGGGHGALRRDRGRVPAGAAAHRHGQSAPAGAGGAGAGGGLRAAGPLHRL